MYSGYGFREFEIGDVDVVKHEGVYHLFHLVLPNHDYIAHATSTDGLHWHRVKNAIFIGDPESWDDDMLWTMHVTPNPYHKGGWRMYYTGLCLRERGRIQRVGLARSNDLYHWEKVNDDLFPLEISGEYYESTLDEGRRWVSFRDPFCFHDVDGKAYLLVAGRVKEGPIIRRGCVTLAEEVAENRFKFRPPLFHPMRYDDIEVPNMVRLNGRYYLIGSIREDIKVHYWYADKFEGPYQNYYDNVLMPQGNYAARVCRDEDRFLVWNFFYKGLKMKGEHLMAPPKELVTDREGQLHLQTFHAFHDLISDTLDPKEVYPPALLFNNPHATCTLSENKIRLGCRSGMEVFLLNGNIQNFMLSGHLSMVGNGKCGFVFRISNDGDGYYLSLDLFKGIAQLRAWRYKPEGGIEESFHYQQLQAANFVTEDAPHPFRLIAYEQYIEFSFHNYVRLSLVDDQFEDGKLGFYVESAGIEIDDLQMNICPPSSKGSYPDGMY